MKWEERHRWVYLGEMDVDEVVVVGIYDSGKEGEGQGMGCVHSSFLPEVGEWQGERASVEIRVLVFGG